MATVNGAAPDMAAPKAKSAIIIAIKKFIRSVRSPIGLTIFLVLYIAFGAAVFKHLEGRNETEIKKPVVSAQKDLIDALWAVPVAVKKNENAFRLFSRKELMKYETKLLEAFQSGVTSDTASKTWDFWGSFFHCITIVTTIGYGNFAAVTDAGRIFTMVYSLIGIPLCLIVMAELGRLLTIVVKYLQYVMICNIHLLKLLVLKVKEYVKKETGEKEPFTLPACLADDQFDFTILIALIVGVLYILLGVLMYQQVEDWSFLEAIYFIFITLSTIGFGDVLPNDTYFFMATSIYIIGGLAIIGMVLGVLQDALDAKVNAAKVKLEDISKTIGLDLTEEEVEVSLEDKNK